MRMSCSHSVPWSTISSMLIRISFMCGQSSSM
jgi:hypothetical protein